MKIIAREKEIKILKTIYESTNSEFLAVYGRRRVGKTYLIKNFFENKGIFFHITGTPRATTQQQLWNFSQIYSDVFNNGDQIEQPGSWQEAFHLLKKGIGRFAAKKIILFLDELPWLANKKSNFVEALSYFWNRFIENDPRIKLIVCGSAASWMIKNVIDNRGGLYNRITKKMRLQPFNLFDTERYLKEKKNVNLSRKQIVEIYMAIGGVASYLDLVTKGRSSAQIISDIFFDQNSPVSGEFDRIFQSLFTNSDLHKKIITTLAGKKNGINRKELFQLTGIKSGSVQTRIINELLESGFIARQPLYGNRKKDASIRLIDEYSAFYTKWFQEITNTRVAVNDNYWLILQNSRKYASWSGHAFETLCMNHVDYIAKALGFNGILYSYASWYYRPTDKTDSGSQIDLLIDRSDNCINLCELKFYNGLFTISKEYAKKLERKKQKFVEITKTKKTVFITMVTFFGTKENDYYREIIANQVIVNDL
jgi:hypothetical protein